MNLAPCVVIAAACLLVAGCMGSSEETTSTATSSISIDSPGSRLESANEPLQDLLAVGRHCFATGVEAVAAQLRAASADAKADAEDDARQARGEMRKSGVDATIVEEVEDNGTCYWVRTNSLFP